MPPPPDGGRKLRKARTRRFRRLFALNRCYVLRTNDS